MIPVFHEGYALHNSGSWALPVKQLEIEVDAKDAVESSEPFLAQISKERRLLQGRKVRNAFAFTVSKQFVECVSALW
jgi:hypothetical protein